MGQLRLGPTREKPLDFNATAPEINLYCDADACQGKRVFEGHQGSRLNPAPWQGFVLQYRCRNCKVNLKCFLVLLSPLKLPGQMCKAIKLGEWPPYGEQMPKRALRLIEPDRQLFLQAASRRTEGLASER